MGDTIPPVSTQHADLIESDTGGTIVRREDFSDVTYLLEIAHPEMARAAHPGQFVIVMSHPEGERIPLTIADFDRDRGTITLVIQAVGKQLAGLLERFRFDVAELIHAYPFPGPIATNLTSK